MANYGRLYSQMLSGQVWNVWKEPARYYYSNAGFCTTLRIAVGKVAVQATIRYSEAFRELGSLVTEMKDSGGVTQAKALTMEAKAQGLVCSMSANEDLILITRQAMAGLTAGKR